MSVVLTHLHLIVGHFEQTSLTLVVTLGRLSMGLQPHFVKQLDDCGVEHGLTTNLHSVMQLVFGYAASFSIRWINGASTPRWSSVR